MKLVGISGSPRAHKSSYFLLRTSLDAAEQQAKENNVELTTELIELGGRRFSGCISCGACQKGLLCSLHDEFQPLIEKLADPEIGGFIFASPVYMGSMTAQMKAFLDRTVPFRRNGFLFRDKIGAAISVGGSRNGGQELTLQSIHAGMMIHDMIIVGNGTHFGSMAWGNHPDGYEQDEVGIQTAQQLGARVARTLCKMNTK